MDKPAAFGDVLEAADNLSAEEQETLIDVLRRRLIERRRKNLATEIQGAREEFKAGACHPISADDLIKEIMS